MATASINSDLQKERNSATFNTESLTEVLYGGKHGVRRRRYLQNIVSQDKYLNSFKPWWNRERNELYEIALRKNVYLQKLLLNMKLTDWRDIAYFTEAGECNEASPLTVHQGMFIPTIQRLGTDEQIAKYLEPARQCKLLGTYAQTEIGHGTFLRGLETTATYDPATEEFILHSPTLSSIKYWPGGLGMTCNYAVVMAQLYTEGKCHGIHAFIVQLRSLKDHRPLPGVHVGDIGNKLGFNSIDNGFLKFDSYRVPREAMLMRYSKIKSDGTYIPAQNTKLTYGTMLLVRAFLVGDCVKGLAQACVIATRYGAVRRQTEIRPGGEEPQVIDYQTQQEKLFPCLAAAYAFLFTSKVLVEEYYRVNADVEKGRYDEMPAIHALSAGLKALSADCASNGIDRLRMACGGHGYTHASGIPKIWSFITPACTFEGENTVMYLQCARFLVKQYELTAKGVKLKGFMSYLNSQGKQTSGLDGSLNIAELIEAYEHTAQRLIKEACTGIQALVRGGLAVEEARIKCSVQMVNAAKAHCQVYVLKVFNNVCIRPGADPSVAKVLQTLCKLYAVYGISQRLGEFIQKIASELPQDRFKDGFLSGQQAEMILEKTLELYAEIRPNAVGLVDSLDYPDAILQSCLGRYDGRVYEALYEYAKSSPLNKQDVHESYNTTLRPLMKGQLQFNTPTARL